jgi:hypothetical protein
VKGFKSEILTQSHVSRFAAAVLAICAASLTTEALTIWCGFDSSSPCCSLPSKYQCEVKNKEVFNGKRVTIDRAEGTHLSQKTNDDVGYFYLNEAPNINYFPENLHNVFKNLEYITAGNSKLRQITQNDLKHFPMLKYLYLAGNQLKTISADVFEYNLELEVVRLYSNQIAHIGPTTFTMLTKLRDLDLDPNTPCPLGNAQTRSAVEAMIAKVENYECFVIEQEASEHLEQKIMNELSLEMSERFRLLEQQNERLFAALSQKIDKKFAEIEQNIETKSNAVVILQELVKIWSIKEKVNVK